ncbi:MAG: hypothetical protein ABTQ73_07650 [Caldilineales bacterium]
MSYRPSQNPSYWASDFKLVAEDSEFLQDYLQNRERPALESDLVQALVEARFRREDQRIRRELARGAVYQPQSSYQVGQTLVFPHLDFAAGTVEAIRPGRNPEHGDFDVLAVTLEPTEKPRYFAASLKSAHKLNLPPGDAGLANEAITGPTEILERHGRELRNRLREQLLALTPAPFVNLGRYWSLAGLLADVHEGHVNIAEAAVDISGKPLNTGEILAQVGLPREVAPALAAFSMDLALSQDERFVDIGVESREWYLERLMPEEAIAAPRRLQYTAESYDRTVLPVPLLQLEWSLNDEWGESNVSTPNSVRLTQVDLALIYPHRRSGTLPLGDRTASFFPVRDGKRSLVTFVDGRWGKRFTGWVVPEERYVCGLGEWYEEHGIPVGGYIVLERTDVPNEVIIDLKPHRSKREWVRMALVEGNHLKFQMQKHTIACDYDETMIVAEADAAATDDLRRRSYRQNVSIRELVDELAPQLMGLSTQGTVHAKTVYSAINLLHRAAPGPVFAALLTNPRFQALGMAEFCMARV